jgi:hypothetical protein
MNRYCFKDEKGEHVHLLDGQPLVGTSQIGNVLAKPLAWYGSGKAVEVFGCPNPKVLTKIKNRKATEVEILDHKRALSEFLPKLRDITVEAYGALIDKAYRAHDTYKRERAVVGTDVHAECEKFVKASMAGETLRLRDFDPAIHTFIAWSANNVKRYLWSEGHCYSEKHWLGGISDVGYETNDGKLGILDFKSTKEAYVSQFLQLAGYQLQIEENGVFTPNGKRLLDPVFYITEYAIFPFGADKPAPAFYYGTDAMKKGFLAALCLYNLLPKQ